MLVWIERYVVIFDQFVEWYIVWWLVVDWLTQFGYDFECGCYFDCYWLLILLGLWGEYDVLGWMVNGMELWGVQRDLVVVDGMLFYKGFLFVFLGIWVMIVGYGWQDVQVDRQLFGGCERGGCQ